MEDKQEGVMDYFSEVPRWVFWSLAIILALTTAAVLAASFLGVMFFFFLGNQSRGLEYASLAGGLAPILLVLGTGWYALETSRIVRENQRAREDEKTLRRKERENELDNLRRALVHEIQAVEGLHELSRNYEPGHSAYTELVPSKVYEGNSDSIGLLTQEEIESVVEYYTLGSMVNDYLAMQRKLDTSLGRSKFEQIYHILSLEWLLFRKEREVRTVNTAERIGELAEAQSEAVMKLKQHIRNAED